MSPSKGAQGPDPEPEDGLPGGPESSTVLRVVDVPAVVGQDDREEVVAAVPVVQTGETEPKGRHETLEVAGSDHVVLEDLAGDTLS